ncbi:aminopeptidase P family protein [Pseudomonadales bacterium]|nr:aminopeptidase P family protein [Pseudomonadales bacterium]
MSDIPVRLAAVRADLGLDNIDALIVPRADEYLGEYVPEQNERLRWISGFAGSAGQVIVLRDRAAIFVDGRYTIQVRQQAPAECFEYRHLIDNPPVAWLCETLAAGARVGVDTRLHTNAGFESMQHQLAQNDIALVEISENFIDKHWHDRPQPQIKSAELLDERYTGEGSEAKRRRIGQLIAAAGAEVAIIAQLDSIAWLLNIRGADVSHLPVILGTATLDTEGRMCFYTDPQKMPATLGEHVGSGVTICAEVELLKALNDLGDKQARLLVDPDGVNAYCVLRAQAAGCIIVAGKDPVLLPKAQKNAVELSGMRGCHVRDGAAVSRYLHWIQQEVSAGRLHDEGVLADRLALFRRASNDLRDLSFDTISAAGANGAMCHYDHRNGTPACLEMNNLYLVDSGGQYPDGTTDITRTVVIGEPTDEHRQMFTLVLKGHIALASAVFPKGTTGVQLDVLARQFLWQAGLDYDHGTSHGVGSYLSVHEGPQRIGKSAIGATELLAGMVLSNEPGYYKEGCYGIRCENLMIVIERDDGMLAFETITFAPFDARLIDETQLSAAELIWINRYHRQVHAKLVPLLNALDGSWLVESTAQIGE